VINLAGVRVCSPDGGEAGAPLLDEDYLILSTIRSAKGQEWNSVFVLNCIDGCIPSDLATESTPESGKTEWQRKLQALTLKH